MQPYTASTQRRHKLVQVRDPSVPGSFHTHRQGSSLARVLSVSLRPPATLTRKCVTERFKGKERMYSRRHKHTHTHIHLYIRTRIHLHVYTTTYIYTCICVHVYVYMYMYTCVCIHVYVYMYMYTCICIHAYVYMYMYTCIVYMYMYTFCMQVGSRRFSSP